MSDQQIFFCDEKKGKILLIAKKKKDIMTFERILAADYEVLFLDELKREVCEDILMIAMDLDSCPDIRKSIETMKELYPKAPLVFISNDPQMEFRCHYLGGVDLFMPPFRSEENILARVKRAIAFHAGKEDMIFEEKSFFTADLCSSREYALINDFEQGIREKEFQVWYQPKFNIREPQAVLSSAEALVRWYHHEYGLLMPADFIPLFEKTGQITKLDAYIWNETAARIRRWKKEKKISVPVSVNVSRKDLYETDLPEMLRKTVLDNGIHFDDLLLEITESAYSDDSRMIIEKVKQLRSEGFLIEMDDFGTGYSSLAMAAELPIDAIKIDMRFVKKAFQKKKDTRLIEIIIEIAGYLKVLTVAEGVENEKQLEELRRLGCDVVQGYYLSKPVPAEEFGRFLDEKLRILAG